MPRIPPHTKRKRLNVNVAPDVHEFYKQLAKDSGQQFTTAVEWALRLYMQEYLTTKRD